MFYAEGCILILYWRHVTNLKEAFCVSVIVAMTEKNWKADIYSKWDKACWNKKCKEGNLKCSFSDFQINSWKCQHSLKCC